jgi:hypothetical protein
MECRLDFGYQAVHSTECDWDFNWNDRKNFIPVCKCERHAQKEETGILRKLIEK